MRNWFIIGLLSVLFTSCQSKVEQQDVPKINGYWEIKEVIFPDGEKKEYTINTTYDYFEIKNDRGFRRKVMPQLDGTFQTNDLDEKVQVSFKDGKTFLNYSTPYSKWKEELKSLADSTMVVVNAEKKEYHYKKTGAINLMGDGKTTK